MSGTIIRIFSDVHFGDPASRVESLDGLRPLFSGADHVIFNGDSIETRRGCTVRPPEEVRGRFEEFVRNAGVGVTLLTGNHDAGLSRLHEMELLGRTVFVTHGEALFEDLVPWSHERSLIRSLFRAELAALPAAERTLPGARLAAAKRACAKLETISGWAPRSSWHRFVNVLRLFWPPRRPLAMIRAWIELPQRAEHFVRSYRPGARFVVLGHTHFPGVWVRPGLVVINTGSFCPPMGCYAVDLSAEYVVVRQVLCRKGRFRFGRVVASFALAPTGESPAATSTDEPDLAPAPAP